MILHFNLTHYISGPVTGFPENNYPAFQRAADRLRKLGLKVVSPHEIPPPSGTFTEEEIWQYYMDRCFEQMSECRAIVMLRGWTQSRGAQIELQKALSEQWEAFYFYQDNPGKLIPMHL